MCFLGELSCASIHRNLRLFLLSLILKSPCNAKPSQLPTLVVEGVGELMAHDYAHGAEVERARVLGVVEWGLQDAGRKHNHVVGG